MHLTRLLFCALLLLAAPFAPAQAPALPYKAHAVTTPDGVKLNVQEWDNPAGPIAGGMIAEDLQKNVDSTRAFLRACFSKQPSADEFEQMVGFNMLVPTIVRRHMLGRPTPYEATLKALKVPVLVTHGIEDKAVVREVGQYTAATVAGAKLSEYPGIGHSPFWEEPVRFNRELAEFVQASNRR